MAVYGELDSNNVCVQVVVTDSSPSSDWVEMTDPLAGIGWTYDKSAQTWSDGRVSTAEQNKDQAYDLLVDCD